MATQQEYSFVANHLLALAYTYIAQLPGFEQAMIPKDKLPQAASVAAKSAVDSLDEYRAAHPPPAPGPTT